MHVKTIEEEPSCKRIAKEKILDRNYDQRFFPILTFIKYLYNEVPENSKGK